MRANCCLLRTSCCWPLLATLRSCMSVMVPGIIAPFAGSTPNLLVVLDPMGYGVSPPITGASPPPADRYTGG